MKGFLFFFGICLIFLVVLVLLQVHGSNDGKLHLIFCNVGQGDAIIIRTPSGSDVLFDGGPNQQALSCLSKYLPFWDRDIELVLLSHPHADHLTGLLDVLDRYTVKSFGTENLNNTTPEFKALMSSLVRQKIEERKLTRGDQYELADGVKLSVVGPTKEYLADTSPTGIISSSEFASLIIHVEYGKFDFLLTGDSQAPEMEANTSGINGLDVLQVPHHGSRTGLTSEILTRLKPKVAIISVGKNNYGHPAKETLGKLKEAGVKFLRTDQEGDIEIVSDGETWEVK